MKNMVSYYQGKKVFITGHTGFKGSWLCHILSSWGAEVLGFSSGQPTEPSLFELSDTEKLVKSEIGDIRDFEHLSKTYKSFLPDIVIHLAAQPLVRESYADPRYTYETNVLGTVNLLECIRLYPSASSVLNVTTDKVYENKEWEWGYRESEALNGFDPYSNSKSCSDIATQSYIKSFFYRETSPAISIARAGNVIGGGDFSKDRIIPDSVEACSKNEVIHVRNPYSIRPYQHVLEPLSAYLWIIFRQASDHSLADCYNVGPNEDDCVTTGKLVSLFCDAWGQEAKWETKAEKNAVHEANFLKLDCSKIKSRLGWYPIWNIDDAVSNTVEWSKAWLAGESVSDVMDRQIKKYFGF